MSQVLFLSAGQKRPDTKTAQVCGGSKCRCGAAALLALLLSLEVGLGSES